MLTLTPAHPRWNDLADYAEACSWRAGPVLARAMREGGFSGWERVFAAMVEGQIAGYCTLTAHDELPEDCGLTPFIGFVFVEERFRGRRLSEKLVGRACAWAQALGFDKVYIMSGEVGLYEKYGFRSLGARETIYGTTDQLFAREIGDSAARRIETERLILRPLTEADAEDVFTWVGDPVVNRYMPYALYENAAQAREWIARIQPEDLEFGFVLRETGRLIGAGSIGFDPRRDAYELGYNLSRAWWGHGYATEAARAMIRWAYETLGARDFVANHAIANTASGNVIRKCGFQFERYGQYARFDGSEVFDAAYYRLRLN